MMKAKVIKTEAEYQGALDRLSELMDAEAGTPEGEELELLSVLLEKYENEHFPIPLPDPIDAIKFRMDQQGLTQKDLVPYIGSQSKVSEVLNRRRPLSLSMIRALHEGLGIPAEVLVQKPGEKLPEHVYNPADYPFSVMYNRGYFSGFKGNLSEANNYAEELLTKLFSKNSYQKQQFVYCRTSQNIIKEPNLFAWQARATVLAEGQKLGEYNKTKLTREWAERVLKLSYYDQGPLLAREHLLKDGIALIILPHLPKTYLDGACFMAPSGNPIIGLTLRHDRLDNFWFTLAHELAHLLLHLKDNQDLAFFDETDDAFEGAKEPHEIEANQFAADMLIPPDLWNKYRDYLLTRADDKGVINFASEVGISPAIVAGRIRWESGEYMWHNKLVGNRAVHKLFFTGN